MGRLKVFLAALLFLYLLPARADTPGCTDPNAPNYNPSATINDGSCSYGNSNYAPQRLATLPAAVRESSGLLLWNGLLWTHNDSGGSPELYALDPDGATVVQRVVRVKNASNVDWEDITHDGEYGYIGDFGNNNGNRTDLKVYRFLLEELEGDTVHAEAILFSYPDQSDFTPRPQNNNFDAEAMIVLDDSLYIFSKNWANERTKVYVLPKTPGTYTARLKTDMFAGGLITGADFNPEDSVIILTAYTKLLQPFIWLLWDFPGAAVFSGNRRKIGLNLPLHQVEGVVWREGHDYLVSNEEFTQVGNISPALHRINTANWIAPRPTGVARPGMATSVLEIFPNPVKDEGVFRWDKHKVSASRLEMYNTEGRMVWAEQLVPGADSLRVDMRPFPAGVYSVILFAAEGQYTVRLMFTPAGR